MPVLPTHCTMYPCLPTVPCPCVPLLLCYTACPCSPTHLQLPVLCNTMLYPGAKAGSMEGKVGSLEAPAAAAQAMEAVGTQVSQLNPLQAAYSSEASNWAALIKSIPYKKVVSSSQFYRGGARHGETTSHSTTQSKVCG